MAVDTNPAPRHRSRTSAYAPSDEASTAARSRRVSHNKSCSTVSAATSWRATRATGDFDLRTFSIRAYPVEKVPELRPGMSASVEIVIDDLHDTISLPIHAVHRQEDHHYVYVAEATGPPKLQEVKIGLYNEKRVAILGGRGAQNQPAQKLTVFTLP